MQAVKGFSVAAPTIFRQQASIIFSIFFLGINKIVAPESIGERGDTKKAFFSFVKVL